LVTCHYFRNIILCRCFVLFVLFQDVLEGKRYRYFLQKNTMLGEKVFVTLMKEELDHLIKESRFKEAFYFLILTMKYLDSEETRIIVSYYEKNIRI